MLIHRIKLLSIAVLVIGLALLLWQNANAAEGGKPSVVILATGGMAATPAEAPGKGG